MEKGERRARKILLPALMLAWALALVPAWSAEPAQAQTTAQTTAQDAAQEVVLDALEQAAADKVAPLVREVDRLRAVYENARKAGDALAEQNAATDLARAESTLERTRIRALAEASGRTEAEIQVLRAEGKGWGQIAKEVGVHPSALGVGHAGRAAPGKSGNGKANGKANGKGQGKGKSK